MRLINMRLIERAVKAAFRGHLEGVKRAVAALAVDNPAVVLRLVPG
jgi:hypothetical protein